MSNKITTVYVVSATEDGGCSPSDFLYGNFQLAFIDKEGASEMLENLKGDACFGIHGDKLAFEVGIEYRVTEIKADYLDNEEPEDYASIYGIDSHAGEQVSNLLECTFN